MCAHIRRDIAVSIGIPAMQVVALADSKTQGGLEPLLETHYKRKTKING